MAVLKPCCVVLSYTESPDMSHNEAPRDNTV